VFGVMSTGGRLEDGLKMLHPADRAQFVIHVDAAVAGARAFDLEYRVLEAADRVRWVKTLGHAEVDAAGHVVKLSGGTVDITERKEIEFEAAAQREILAHAARVGVLGELSGAIAHELSQPLGAILSNAQAAMRVLERSSIHNTELREIITDIIDDNKRARDVISHLRTLLKKGSAKSELLDLNEEVKEALSLAHSELIRRRVDVTVELDPRVPPVTGDRIQLEQVLLNLILNAAEAINSTKHRGHLTITTGFGQNGAPQISVRDDGPGLSDEVMSHLFEPFFSTKAYGLGLGLSICKSIVAAHSGRLWAVNNPEGGATFFVSFPSLARKAA
jgi:C4-dicarboxylate-specific signal transduction histidine kinase